MKRIAKVITDKKDIELLLSIEEENITTSFMMSLFGEFNGKRKFNPYDILEVPVNSYGPEGHKNKNKFTTTVGLWIFNKYFIEKDLIKVFGYINKTVNKKIFKKLHQQMAYALIEDDITVEQFKRFIMKPQFFQPFVSILSPSYTDKMLTSIGPINKKKQELYKKYKDKIDAGDAKAADEMGKELLAFAKQYLEGDPSMDSYDSGARGSFGNNFKNMYCMKGAVQNPDPSKGYDILMSNYMTGVSKEEYSAFANSLAAGPYARARKTADGGYWEKLFLAAYQHIKLDPKGSDCGTKHYITVDLTSDNIGMYMYSYIVDGSKLVLLNSKNMDKYIGKKVKFRFASMCKSHTGICNKCIGDLPYIITQNIGMAAPIIPSTLKNLSMKSFHDSQVSLIEIDPMKVFL